MDERLVVEPGKHRVNSTGLKIISCDDGLGAVAFVVEGYAEIMAAAPELLEALEQIAEWSDDDRAKRVAEAAIAKATGGA